MIPQHKDTIMIHCLATKPSWGKGKAISAIVKEVRKWHVQERGWRDIAYAEIIGYSGARGKGRDLDGDGDVWEETGAGAKGWNKNVIHIALVGGYGGSADDAFATHFTAKQNTTLRKVIREIIAEAGRPMRVIGHNEVAAKACPCFDVQVWMSEDKSPPGRPVPVSQSPLAALIAAILAIFRKGNS